MDWLETYVLVQVRWTRRCFQEGRRVCLVRPNIPQPHLALLCAMSGPRGLGRLSNNVFSAHVAEPRKGTLIFSLPASSKLIVYCFASKQHGNRLEVGPLDEIVRSADINCPSMD